MQPLTLFLVLVWVLPANAQPSAAAVCEKKVSGPARFTAQPAYNLSKIREFFVRKYRSPEQFNALSDVVRPRVYEGDRFVHNGKSYEVIGLLGQGYSMLTCEVKALDGTNEIFVLKISKHGPEEFDRLNKDLLEAKKMGIEIDEPLSVDRSGDGTALYKRRLAADLVFIGENREALRLSAVQVAEIYGMHKKIVEKVESQPGPKRFSVSIPQNFIYDFENHRLIFIDPA